MKLELTLSGLCVLVLRRTIGDQSEQPATLESVDVLCVGPHGGHEHGHARHRPRLSFAPEDLLPDGVLGENERPDLVVDPTGRRFASLDLGGRSIELSLVANPNSKVSVTWGADAAEVPASTQEDFWMNWIPPVQDLGFPKLVTGAPGQPVPGASVLLSLKGGTLSGRSVVRRGQPNVPIRWKFPAAIVNGSARIRAVANEAVFEADGLKNVIVKVDGRKYSYTKGGGGVLQMALSNDLAQMDETYLSGSDKLEHLGDIEALSNGRGGFQPPVLAPEEPRTGHPICNQARYMV
jgi:hypothetical protein